MIGDGTCTTQLKGQIGDQDAIEYLCKEAPRAVVELEDTVFLLAVTTARFIKDRLAE